MRLSTDIKASMESDAQDFVVKLQKSTESSIGDLQIDILKRITTNAQSVIEKIMENLSAETSRTQMLAIKFQLDSYCEELCSAKIRSSELQLEEFCVEKINEINHRMTEEATRLFNESAVRTQIEASDNFDVQIKQKGKAMVDQVKKELSNDLEVCAIATRQLSKDQNEFEITNSSRKILESASQDIDVQLRTSSQEMIGNLLKEQEAELMSYFDRSEAEIENLKQRAEDLMNKLTKETDFSLNSMKAYLESCAEAQGKEQIVAIEKLTQKTYDESRIYLKKSLDDFAFALVPTIVKDKSDEIMSKIEVSSADLQISILNDTNTKFEGWKIDLEKSLAAHSQLLEAETKTRLKESFENIKSQHMLRIKDLETDMSDSLSIKSDLLKDGLVEKLQVLAADLKLKSEEEISKNARIISSKINEEESRALEWKAKEISKRIFDLQKNEMEKLMMEYVHGIDFHAVFKISQSQIKHSLDAVLEAKREDIVNEILESRKEAFKSDYHLRCTVTAEKFEEDLLEIIQDKFDEKMKANKLSKSLARNARANRSTNPQTSTSVNFFIHTFSSSIFNR